MLVTPLFWTFGDICPRFQSKESEIPQRQKTIYWIFPVYLRMHMIFRNFSIVFVNCVCFKIYFLIDHCCKPHRIRQKLLKLLQGVLFMKCLLVDLMMNINLSKETSKSNVN